MNVSSPFCAVALLLLLSGCHDHDDDHDVHVEHPHYVSILVEVFDPATNLVWENVTVTILEADQEWSNSTWISPAPDSFLTNEAGQVLLDEFVLGDADVGFREDRDGAALLWPDRDEDEAVVVLQVDAPGFVPVIVEVPLRWNDPDVFVEVPFD